MPNLLDWKDQSFQQRTNMVLDMFELSDSQVNSVMDVWTKREYIDNWNGHEKAIADLMSLLRWESLSPMQREEEKQRMARRK